MQKRFLKIIFALLIGNLLLFVSQTKNIAYSSTVFSDDFNRPNNTSLGSNWVIFYGGQPAGIEDNQAYIEVGAGGNWGFYKVNGLNIQDQDVSVTFTHQNGDTTLLARVIDVSNRIAINYYKDRGLEIYEVYQGGYRLIQNTAPNAIIGATYTFRVRIVGDSLKVWINGIQYADATLNHITSGSAGFGANDGYTKVVFDDFIVRDTNTDTPSPTPTIAPTSTPTLSPSPTVSPSPSPTPTPTIAPTPTPIIPVLNVPNLKQYSEPWQSNIYDHIAGTIKQFGCALTSASMVLKYHGHDIMPGALNNWLNSQSDGYIGNGLINWLAVSRYTKLNDSTTSPTLEYKRLPATENKLDDELNNNRPAILKENGHFVVGTGKLSTGIFIINDPAYESRTTLEPYGNSFLAINSYKPTHSDLSYMMFTADSDILLELVDSNGNTISTENFIEDPIVDQDNSSNISGDPLSILLFEKPQSGDYKLKISGDAGDYALNSYLYNTNGVVTQNNFAGHLLGSDTDIYNISFDPLNSVELSPDGILENLDLAYQNKLIKNKGIYQEIKIHIELYKRFGSKKIINLLIKQIKILTPKLIDQTYSLNLQQDLMTLID